MDGAIVEKEPKILVNLYHEERGHINFAVTCATEKAWNIKREGRSACVLSKAKQKFI